MVSKRYLKVKDIVNVPKFSKYPKDVSKDVSKDVPKGPRYSKST